MSRALDLLKALISSPWLPLVAAVVLSFSLIRACNRADRAEVEAARLAEAVRLRSADLVVAEQGRHAARTLADELVGANEGLRAERDRALAAAHDARVALVAALRTGPLVAGGTPRPSTPPGDPGVAPATPVLPAACLLASGDTGDIRVDQLELETRAGNRVLVGTAQAWRLTPAPETLLFGGPFRSEFSQVAIEPPPREPGWGVGMVASLGGGVASVGPALAFPPLRVLGFQLEATAGVTVMGEVRLFGSAVVRP